MRFAPAASAASMPVETPGDETATIPNWREPATICAGGIAETPFVAARSEPMTSENARPIQSLAGSPRFSKRRMAKRSGSGFTLPRWQPVMQALAVRRIAKAGRLKNTRLQLHQFLELGQRLQLR